VAVALEHLTADVSGKVFDRLLAHARILSQSRHERVSQVMQPFAHASVTAGNSSCHTVVFAGTSVTFAVTTDAKRNQVVHHIATEPAPT